MKNVNSFQKNINFKFLTDEKWNSKMFSIKFISNILHCSMKLNLSNSNSDNGVFSFLSDIIADCKSNLRSILHSLSLDIIYENEMYVG